MRVPILLFVVLAGCTSKPTATVAVPTPPVSPLPLVAPADPRPPVAVLPPSSGDEFENFAATLAQTKEPPRRVRARFGTLVRVQRRAFSTRQASQRREFQADEAKAREVFTESQHQQRDDFFAQKHDMADTGKFTHALNRERIKVIVEERAREKEFDRKLRAHRREFEGTVRRRTAEFNEFYLRYLKRAPTVPLEKNSVTGDGGKQSEPAATPASPLGTGE